MHRLEHRRVLTRGVDVCAGSQADATGHRSCEVGDDVSEEVVGDDDVEMLWLLDQSDRHGIDVHVVGRHLGELHGDLVDNSTPQRTGVDENIVLVDEGEVATTGSCSREGVANDPLNPEGSVDAHLGGNLVGGSGPH